MVMVCLGEFGALKQEGVNMFRSYKAMLPFVFLTVVLSMFLLVGCPIHYCLAGKQLVSVTTYVYSDGALDQTYTDLDSETIRLEAVCQNLRAFSILGQTPLKATVLTEDQVPSPLFGDDTRTYQVFEYYRIEDGELAAYFIQSSIKNSFDYENRTTATRRVRRNEILNDQLELWRYGVVPETKVTTVPTLEKRAFNDFLGSNPQESQWELELEIQRRESLPYYLAFLDGRVQNTGTIILPANEVPEAPGDQQRCYCCAYDKVVNGVLVEHYGSWDERCGECGTKINSYTIVIDGVVIEDVIQAWDYWR